MLLAADVPWPAWLAGTAITAVCAAMGTIFARGAKSEATSAKDQATSNEGAVKDAMTLIVANLREHGEVLNGIRMMLGRLSERIGELEGQEKRRSS